MIDNPELSCLFDNVNEGWIRKATVKEQQLMMDHSSELHSLLEEVMLLHKNGYDHHGLTAEQQRKIIAKLKTPREEQAPDFDYYPIHSDFK